MPSSEGSVRFLRQVPDAATSSSMSEPSILSRFFHTGSFSRRSERKYCSMVMYCLMAQISTAPWFWELITSTLGGGEKEQDGGGGGGWGRLGEAKSLHENSRVQALLK